MELTPASMTDRIRDHILEITSGMYLGDKTSDDNTDGKVKVFTMDLPPRQVPEYEVMTDPYAPQTLEPVPNQQTLETYRDERFPFVIVRFLRSTDTDDMVRLCEIDLICGVEAEGLQAQKDTLHLMEVIRQSLLKHDYAGWGFRIARPLDIDFFEEQTDPYFIGVVSTNWEAPTIQTEVRLW
ncbi:hypothetical protein [Paenibacillus polymyxa]|uniref:hypothetical protein n=1 Tax=Paenibacillus polymyxa TaxID=1406 RepID=UPI000400C845|nr:hypothetical protein [Paenibacillus polymyxa]